MTITRPFHVPLTPRMAKAVAHLQSAELRPHASGFGWVVVDKSKPNEVIQHASGRGLLYAEAEEILDRLERERRAAL